MSSYHAGETLKLRIMRQQKRIELPIQMPADGARKEARAAIRLLPDDDPAPLPPVPPAPAHASTQL